MPLSNMKLMLIVLQNIIFGKKKTKNTTNNISPLYYRTADLAEEHQRK